MFFTPELLSRRDSGFGLLWLAATLGAKSSFKKLPKRSVITADISQLCDLIAEPAEPLALRLSSNLMIGVARIYKVKQEIFLADVTTCSNTIKKAVQDIRAIAAAADQLQMGQPSVRPDTVTLAADPANAFAIDFDHLFTAWDDYPIGAGADRQNDEESDEEFNPRSKKSKKKQKQKAKASSVSLAEDARAGAHTLNETHDYLLSASFDASFGSGFGGVGPSSSQADPGFGFDDNFLDPIDIGADIGDELARELGEGWGGSLDNGRHETHDHADPFEPNTAVVQGLAMDLDLGGDLDFGDQDMDATFPPGQLSSPAGTLAAGDIEEEHIPELGQDALLPTGSVIVPLSPFGSQDQEQDGQGNERQDPTQEVQKKPTQRKAKRVRLLLDARTELTDEELQSARANYIQEQARIRREVAQKKAQRDSGKIIEEMILGVPRGVNAPVLVDFWLENFRLQVEARSGQLHMDTEGEPPKKRRKVGDEMDEMAPPAAQQIADEDGPAVSSEWNRDIGGDMADGGIDLAMGGMDDAGDIPLEANRDIEMGGVFDDGVNAEIGSRLRSSEEPGQARRVSRAPSVTSSQFGLNARATQDIISGSQRSSLFPWDDAGVSSSVAGNAFDVIGGSARLSVGPADHRVRGNSLGSRRESSLPQTVPPSPAGFGLQGYPLEGEGFEFELPGEDESQLESQTSEKKAKTLERNSNNFLEYAKMQLNAYPSSTSTLTFDDVVPLATSTVHVAAAAFYHCLVLSTRDLIEVKQEEPYGTLRITVK